MAATEVVSPRRGYTSLLGSRTQSLDVSNSNGFVYFKPGSLPGSPQGSPRRVHIHTRDQAYFKFSDGVSPDLLLVDTETSYMDDSRTHDVVFSIKRDENQVLWQQFLHLVIPLLKQIIESMPDAAILNDEDNMLGFTPPKGPFLFYQFLTNKEMPQFTYMRVERSKPRVLSIKPSAPLMSASALVAAEIKQAEDITHLQRRVEGPIILAAARKSKGDVGIGGFLQARQLDRGLTYETYLRRLEKDRK